MAGSIRPDWEILTMLSIMSENLVRNTSPYSMTFLLSRTSISSMVLRIRDKLFRSSPLQSAWLAIHGSTSADAETPLLENKGLGSYFGLGADAKTGPLGAGFSTATGTGALPISFNGRGRKGGGGADGLTIFVSFSSSVSSLLLPSRRCLSRHHRSQPS